MWTRTMFVSMTLVHFLTFFLGSDSESSFSLVTKFMSTLQEQSRCYGDLGCFNLSDPWLTWSRPVPLLPQEINEIRTQFYLQTRFDPDMKILLRTRPEIDLSNTRYNGSHWTFFLVHGWRGTANDQWINELSRELLNMFDCNVISVDWSRGASVYNYIQAISNTRLVGAEMSRLGTYLIQYKNSSRSRMHLIGYSLGGQIVAYMANNLTYVQRITAFDPAQPGFEDTHPIVHLDRDDARFVDIIHTNSRPFFPDFGFGFRNSVGHVDFFLNGGEYQPECRRQINVNYPNQKELQPGYIDNMYSILKNFLDTKEDMEQNIRNKTKEIYEMVENIRNQQFGGKKESRILSLGNFLVGKISDLVNYIVCSHEKAPTYFTQTLRYQNCSFWGRMWTPFSTEPVGGVCNPESCSEMGFYAVLYPALGSFYVQTNPNTPYCKWEPETEVRMKRYLAESYLRQVMTES